MPHGDPLPPDENAAPDGPGGSAPIDFSVDLSSHETLRRAHVLAALGPDWDPVAALRDEEEAHRLLYSGLDAEQQRLYDELVSAGVLPGRGDGRAPA
ncbi:DUF6400 family protein [Streptomyces viridosporus]|uniref:DUF6400 family protein n=1 Tax=Streptomyces viridosporus TaxID=67581 RepID=UPI0003045653|nr:DUF6400 family protein [Streptomyces viridosporus]